MLHWISDALRPKSNPTAGRRCNDHNKVSDTSVQCNQASIHIQIAADGVKSDLLPTNTIHTSKDSNFLYPNRQQEMETSEKIRLKNSKVSTFLNWERVFLLTCALLNSCYPHSITSQRCPRCHDWSFAPCFACQNSKESRLPSSTNRSSCPRPLGEVLKTFWGHLSKLSHTKFTKKVIHSGYVWRNVNETSESGCIHRDQQLKKEVMHRGNASKVYHPAFWWWFWNSIT